MVGESPLGTDASQWVDACLYVYFKDGICVRLESNNEIPGTALGVHEDNSYSPLIEQCGDSFDKIENIEKSVEWIKNILEVEPEVFNYIVENANF